MVSWLSIPSPSYLIYSDFSLGAVDTIVKLYLGDDAPDILDRRWQAVKHELSKVIYDLSSIF